MDNHYIERVIDLTDPKKNIIYNMTYEEAVTLLKTGETDGWSQFDH
jgi:asparagine synthase (glutamine-hydrolysing)